MPYCYTCCKSFKSLGVARHRAMHRDKEEDCLIQYLDGSMYLHEFSKKLAKQRIERKAELEEK